jgi:hypothetical protein
MLRQEPLHGFGLVRRQIVQHDMNFLRPTSPAEQLVQEGDELRAGVPLRRLTLHLAGFHIQSGI